MKLDYAAIVTTIALACTACYGEEQSDSSRIRLTGRVDAQRSGSAAEFSGSARVQLYVRGEAGTLDPIADGSTAVDAKGEYSLEMSLDGDSELVAIAKDDAGEIGRAAASIHASGEGTLFLPPINSSSSSGTSLLIEADAQSDVFIGAAWLELAASSYTRLALDVEDRQAMAELASLVDAEAQIWASVSSSAALGYDNQDYLAALTALALEVSDYYQDLHDDGAAAHSGAAEAAVRAYGSVGVAPFHLALAAQAALDAATYSSANASSEAALSLLLDAEAQLDYFARSTVLEARLWSEAQREELVQLAAALEANAEARSELAWNEARLAFSAAVEANLRSSLGLGDSLVATVQDAIEASRARVRESLQSLDASAQASAAAELWVDEWVRLSTQSEASALLSAQLGEQEAQVMLELLFAVTGR